MYEEENEDFYDSLTDEDLDWLRELFLSCIPKERIAILNKSMERAVKIQMLKIAEFLLKHRKDEDLLPEIKVDFWEVVNTSLYMQIIFGGNGLMIEAGNLHSVIEQVQDDCLIEIFPRTDARFTICLTFRNVKKVVYESGFNPPDWILGELGIDPDDTEF